jgi:hypothetical protein
VVIRNFKFVLIDIMNFKILSNAFLCLYKEGGGAEIKVIVGLAMWSDEMFFN